MTIKIKIKETGEIKEISARIWDDICNYGDKISFSPCEGTEGIDYICDQYTYDFWSTFETEITAAERRLQDLKKEYGHKSEEIERLEREIQDQQCDLEDLPYVMTRSMDQLNQRANNMKHIIIEKTTQGFRLLTLYKGRLYSRHYMGYSIKEASKLFQEYVLCREN